jgi:hypothetical protein
MNHKDNPLIPEGWHVQYDPKPIPDRRFDWGYVHEDYDGAPDSGDTRCGACPSVKACIDEINELHKGSEK